MALITRRTAAAGFAAASLAACTGPTGTAFSGRLSFRHGVASGDPGADRVVIWTRVSPEGTGVVPVRWIVARDEALSAIVRSGEAQASAERDFTVKVDVDGLSPGQRYFYGFIAGEEKSPVGRTRTLPSAGVAEIKLAVASCSSFSHGFFNAYEALSKREDVDFVLHLGDYIYEYGLSGYGGQEALALARLPRPNVECVTLEDYRARHAQYKEERELQAAHAAFAWFVAWDDHEVADDSYAQGAFNHQRNDGEGEWPARAGGALRAYYEWMPIRDPAPTRRQEQAWRSVDFGDLATLVLLETRLSARDRPLEYLKDLKPISAVWDFADPNNPKRVAFGAPRPLAARDVPVPFDVSTNPPTPIEDWRRIRAIDPQKPPFGVAFLPDLEALNAQLDDPKRRMLGEDQEAFLLSEIARSRLAGAPWQVIGNQTLFAQITAPDVSKRFGPEALAALEKALPGAQAYLDLTAFRVPLSLDAWDGYRAQRHRILSAVSGGDSNLIVLTGDSHGAWVNEIYAPQSETLAAVEFGATSITSSGLGDLFANAPFDFDQMLVDANKEVAWSNQKQRGFLVVALRREEAVAEFVSVSNIVSKDYTSARSAMFRVRTAPGAGVGKPEPVTT